jgi:uncharacterized protein YqeY
MSLESTVNADIKNAMLSQDKRRLEAIRAVKAAILLEKTSKGGSGDLAPDTEMKILQKLVKQRRESADIYKVQNRPDLAEEELFQASVIEKYLPAQMSADDLKAAIGAIITETGARDIKDLGRVMGAATKALAGKADNKSIAALVKELLGGT